MKLLHKGNDVEEGTTHRCRHAGGETARTDAVLQHGDLLFQHRHQTPMAAFPFVNDTFAKILVESFRLRKNDAGNGGYC